MVTLLGFCRYGRSRPNTLTRCTAETVLAECKCHSLYAPHQRLTGQCGDRLDDQALALAYALDDPLSGGFQATLRWTP
jgi:hypothetical protein